MVKIWCENTETSYWITELVKMMWKHWNVILNHWTGKNMMWKHWTVFSHHIFTSSVIQYDVSVFSHHIFTSSVIQYDRTGKNMMWKHWNIILNHWTRKFSRTIYNYCVNMRWTSEVVNPQENNLSRVDNFMFTL
jgi:hypothetical protein